MLKETFYKFFKVEQLLESLTGFIEGKIDLFRVEINERAKKGISIAILYCVAAVAALMFLLFLSVAVAVSIASQLGWFFGFLAVSIFYLLIFCALLIWRKPVMAFLEKHIQDIMQTKRM